MHPHSGYVPKEIQCGILCLLKQISLNMQNNHTIAKFCFRVFSRAVNAMVLFLPIAYLLLIFLNKNRIIFRVGFMIRRLSVLT